METKRLQFDAELKFSDAGSGSFEGYASTFANWDSVGERPVKGAFAKHLPSFINDGFITIGHDWYKLPIATVSKAAEDEHGLYLFADFHSTQQAQEARAVMAERAARGKGNKLSIGYQTLKDNRTAQGRELVEVKLLEVSYVTIPANSAASITAVKGLTLDDHTQQLLQGLTYWEQRLTDIAALRTEQKRGAVLSGANKERVNSAKTSLLGIVDILDELLALAESDPKGVSPEELKHRLQLIQTQINTLGV